MRRLFETYKPNAENNAKTQMLYYQQFNFLPLH